MINKKEIYITEEDLNNRLDVLLSKKLNISRAKAQEYIDQELVFFNDLCLKKNSYKFKECVTVSIIERNNSNIILMQHDIYKQINIIFEHEDFIIIDKPPLLSSHKAHKNDLNPNVADWFMNTRFFKDERITEDKRVGIIHRLDKETSGIMILARTYKAQKIISDLFKDRKVKKTYIGITDKSIVDSGKIIYNIMRNPLNPTQMTFSHNQGRTAETLFQVKQRKDNLSLVYFYPKTGRTHQIRVHMQSINASLLSDKVYGQINPLINRHALHALEIEFEYNDNQFKFISEIPKDIASIIN